MQAGLARCLAFIFMLAMVAGCASIDSTLLTRDNGNSTWEKHPKLRGVPITLKVPTHMKVYVYQKHFMYASKTGMKRLELPYVVRDFSYEFLESEKIFTVDFRRPAAGTYNLRLDLTDQQYIDQVQHDVVDETLTDVQTLLGSIGAKGIFAPVGGNFAADGIPETELKEVNSVVAVQIFEIDSPSFEQDVTDFVNCHLNNSHDAFVVPPSVNSINRPAIPLKKHETDICNGIFETTEFDPPIPNGGHHAQPSMPVYQSAPAMQPNTGVRGSSSDYYGNSYR